MVTASQGAVTTRRPCSAAKYEPSLRPSSGLFFINGTGYFICPTYEGLYLAVYWHKADSNRRLVGISQLPPVDRRPK